jgi:hypothetical protein
MHIFGSDILLLVRVYRWDIYMTVVGIEQGYYYF